MDALKIIAAFASVVFGVVAIVQPILIAQFAGLDASSTRGTAEVRINWGGLFIALGLGAIALNTPDAYRLFGIGYAGLAVMRLVEGLRQRALWDRGFVVTLLFEAASAIIFLL